RIAPMTANLRMAPPYLYRICRLVQTGGSHVQQSAPSRHITLDSDGLIHVQPKEHFTHALPGLPHPAGEQRPGVNDGPMQCSAVRSSSRLHACSANMRGG